MKKCLKLLLLRKYPLLRRTLALVVVLFLLWRFLVQSFLLHGSQSGEFGTSKCRANSGQGASVRHHYPSVPSSLANPLEYGLYQNATVKSLIASKELTYVSVVLADSLLHSESEFGGKFRSVGGTGHWFHLMETLLPLLHNPATSAVQAIWRPAAFVRRAYLQAAKVAMSDFRDSSDSFGASGAGTDAERSKDRDRSRDRDRDKDKEKREEMKEKKQAWQKILANQPRHKLYVVFQEKEGVEALDSFGRFVLAAMLSGGLYDEVIIGHAASISVGGAAGLKRSRDNDRVLGTATLDKLEVSEFQYCIRTPTQALFIHHYHHYYHH